MGEKILADVTDALKEEETGERMDKGEQEPTNPESHLKTLLSTHSFCLSIFGGEGLHPEASR